MICQEVFYYLKFEPIYHVWDMNFDPKSNVIESNVKFLRQKIDTGFSSRLIHTVRGSGYIFSLEKN